MRHNYQKKFKLSSRVFEFQVEAVGGLLSQRKIQTNVRMSIYKTTLKVRWTL